MALGIGEYYKLRTGTRTRSEKTKWYRDNSSAHGIRLVAGVRTVEQVVPNLPLGHLKVPKSKVFLMQIVSHVKLLLYVYCIKKKSCLKIEDVQYKHTARLIDTCCELSEWFKATSSD